MPKYYVTNNAQANGDHEVHQDGCNWLYLVSSKKDLGYHANCKSAVETAKTYYHRSNGCKYCSEPCHTT